MKKTHLTLICLFFFSALWAQDEDVLFQAFDWNVHQQPPGTTWYQVVDDNLAQLDAAGIDVIWLPPVSDSGAPQGYLPRELYNLNSAYGSQQELIDLINKAHTSNIKVLGDIVINHRVGTVDAVTFTNPAWPTFYICSDDEGPDFVNYPVNLSINPDYVPGTFLKADGSSGQYGPARDLDHRNPAVRQEIITWMNFLKNDIGLDGWRYDFVHGYDPAYNKVYNDATSPYFAVAELLESSRVQLNNWLSLSERSSSIFDFNTKVSLQNALRDNNLSYLRDFSGNASGLLGIDPGKSVTFLDNHDTGEAQQCCGSGFVFPGDEASLRKGYAYILTHPGNPMVFWTHFFDRGAGVRQAINDLIAIRKEARVYATSPLNIVEARNDLYAAVIQGRNGRVAMKLGSANWSPSGGNWTLRSFGNDYAVWTEGTTQPVSYKVYFKKPTSGWGSNVNLYLYNSSTNSTLSGTAGWPGQSASRIGNSQWYEYQINLAGGVSPNQVGLVYNDGNGSQTTDLSRASEGWFTVNGSANGQSTGFWSDSCPSDCPGDVVSNSYDLYFNKPTSGWGNNVNIYLFSTQTNSTLSGTSGWPGQSATKQGNTNWYKYTVNVPSGVAASSIGLVYNNGQSTQTVDLMRGSEGWFSVTGSQNGQLTGTWSANCNQNCPSNARQGIGTSLLDNSIKVFPNPFKTELRLSVPAQTQMTISLSDLSGKEVYSWDGITDDDTITIAPQKTMSKGVYVIKIKTSDDIFLRKVIKE